MIDIRRDATRPHTNISWLDSWHSFSFGEHHDPNNVGHGLLIVSNDDTVAAGQGFGTHPHRDMEIITWVLSGAVEHRDSEGNHAVIRPGLAQRMSAGTGIRHSERNPSEVEPAHFVQMWVQPDTLGVKPGYEDADVTDALAGGGLVKIASGTDDAAIHIYQANAALYVARLDVRDAINLPEAVHVHVFIARGAAVLETGEALETGDAVRLTNDTSRRLAATESSEIIVWATA